MMKEGEDSGRNQPLDSWGDFGDRSSSGNRGGSGSNFQRRRSPPSFGTATSRNVVVEKKTKKRFLSKPQVLASKLDVPINQEEKDDIHKNKGELLEKKVSSEPCLSSKVSKQENDSRKSDSTQDTLAHLTVLERKTRIRALEVAKIREEENKLNEEKKRIEEENNKKTLEIENKNIVEVKKEFSHIPQEPSDERNKDDLEETVVLESTYSKNTDSKNEALQAGKVAKEGEVLKETPLQKKPADLHKKKPHGVNSAGETEGEHEQQRYNRYKRPPNVGARHQEERRSVTSRAHLVQMATSSTEEDDGIFRRRGASLASLRRRNERGRRKLMGAQSPPEKVKREVILPDVITIQELASRMAERAVDIIKILMKQGVVAKPADAIDVDTAQLLAEELGHTVKRVSEKDVEDNVLIKDDNPSLRQSRAPVVTVMGHVDHGKTSLLDAIFKSAVVHGEEGGITQRIGARSITLSSGAFITFLDTPGHEAFTAMRARGAKVTDLVVLVVAADDGVMLQTVEAIKHAKEAKVPIVVAINKIDKPNADIAKIKQALLLHEVVLEEYGGDVLSVEVSAKEGRGLDKLLEIILLQAEIMGLKANFDGRAEGVILENRLDKGFGPICTAIIQRGTLHVGDIVVAGTQWGRIRVLLSDRKKVIFSAHPSVSVEIVGFSGIPESGDILTVVESEAKARDVVEYRKRMKDEKRLNKTRILFGLSDITQEQPIKRKTLAIIIKADVHGSCEAIVQNINKMGNDEVMPKIILSGVGAITQSDIHLALVSQAMIIGFNVRAIAQAKDLIEKSSVTVRYYSVIYRLLEDVEDILSGMLEPEIKETRHGEARVLDIFKVSKIGKVAGCLVVDGFVKRHSNIRIIRDGIVMYSGRVDVLKHFKDDVKEVRSGQECGIFVGGYQDFKKDDVIECFETYEVRNRIPTSGSRNSVTEAYIPQTIKE